MYHLSIGVEAIPTYFMGLFKLPVNLCDTINSTLTKYWWGQTEEEKKIIGSMGRNYVPQKLRVKWDFETFMPSILQCLLNKLENWYTTRTLCSIEVIKHGIFLIVLSWKLLWGLTPPMYGEVSWQPKKWLGSGLGGGLVMAKE